MVRAVLLYVLLICVAVPAAAQDAGLKRLDTGDDSRGWEAVGRLDIGGTGFCTGALIAPDLVLTAAHCLFDKATGERVDEAKIEFLAGWRNGRASAYRWVKRAVTHPEFVYEHEVVADRVRNDVALLQLQLPIRDNDVLPFDTDTRPSKGDRIGVVSYAVDRSDAPSLQEICAVLARQQGVLIMSCDVDFGSSGAPVFTFEGGKPRIVSVVSAKADVDGRQVSLGTQLEEPLMLLRGLIAASGKVFQPTTKRLEGITVGGARRDTGAKFVKP